MRPIIVIPTYWAPLRSVKRSVFDHPTPLGEKGTLGRCLRSMEKARIDEKVLLFYSPFRKSVHDKVKNIASVFGRLDIEIFGSRDMDYLRDALRGSPRRFRKHINLDTYPNIRNICLLFSSMKGADAVIQIDDDVLVKERGFVERAIFSLGKDVQGKTLLGKTGFYINRRGGWRLRQKNRRIRRLWLKETYINKAIELALSGSRLSRTSMALGGCMTLHKNLFRTVPYDPFNTRGEDTDYLMNSRYLGHGFLFDSEMKVLHIQPERIAPYWTKMRQDIYRFVYEREKLKVLGMEPSEFDPYPGLFLRDDLEKRIDETCSRYTRACLMRDNIADAREWEKNRTTVLEDAKKRAFMHRSDYPDFQREWERFVKEL